MARFANRTCYGCGRIAPANEMVNTEVARGTTKGKTGLSGMTFLGAALGHKGSKNSIGSWIFNTGQRNYTGKKKVFLCQSCSKDLESKNFNIYKLLFFWIYYPYRISIFFLQLTFVFPSQVIGRLTFLALSSVIDQKYARGISHLARFIWILSALIFIIFIVNEK